MGAGYETGDFLICADELGFHVADVAEVKMLRWSIELVLNVREEVKHVCQFVNSLVCWFGRGDNDS